MAERGGPPRPGVERGGAGGLYVLRPDGGPPARLDVDDPGCARQRLDLDDDASRPPCMAHQLRVLRAGRQGGGFQTVAVMVQIENTAWSACVLDRPPYALSLVGTGESGAALAVAYLPGAAGAARTLGAGAVGEADLNWANWCQGDPGPLVIRFTLRSGGGAVESLMDGPSGVGYVPECNDPRRPSSITFLEWATEPPG